MKAEAYKNSLQTYKLYNITSWLQLVKHDYELRCSAINAIQKKRKTYLLGEHVDEEWWIVLNLY